MNKPSQAELEVLTSWGIQFDDPSKIAPDLIISARRDLSLKASLDVMLDNKLCGVNSRISNLEDRITNVEQVSRDFNIERLEALEVNFETMSVGMLGLNSYVGKLHGVISSMSDKICKLTTAYNSVNAQLVTDNLRSRRLNCRIYGIEFPAGAAKSKSAGARFIWQCGLYRAFSKTADDSHLPYVMVAHPLPEATPKPAVGDFKRSSIRAIVQFSTRQSAMDFWQNQKLFLDEAKRKGFPDVSIGSDWNAPSSSYLHRFSKDPRTEKIQILDGNLICRLASNPARAIKVQNPHALDLMESLQPVSVPDLSSQIPSLPVLQEELSAARQQRQQSQLSHGAGLVSNRPSSAQPSPNPPWHLQVDLASNQFGILSSPASSPQTLPPAVTAPTFNTSSFAESIITLNTITSLANSNSTSMHSVPTISLPTASNTSSTFSAPLTTACPSTATAQSPVPASTSTLLPIVTTSLPAPVTTSAPATIASSQSPSTDSSLSTSSSVNTSILRAPTLQVPATDSDNPLTVNDDVVGGAKQRKGRGRPKKTDEA